jgi:hypothetical protein
MKIALLSTVATLGLVGCAANELPPSSPSKGVGVFNYSPSLDNNGDELITHDEWLAAGGVEGRIRPAGDDRVLTPVSTDSGVARLIKTVADLGQDEPLTPTEFRSPPGARVASLQF